MGSLRKEKNINAIEMIQRRAARYVTNRYERYASVTEMLKELQWDSLEERRRRQRLVMFYKIHHNQFEVNKDAYIRQSSNSRPSRYFNNKAYEIPGTGPEYYNNSFFPQTIREWNRLPQGTVELNSLIVFKNALGSGGVAKIKGPGQTRRKGAHDGLTSFSEHGNLVPPFTTLSMICQFMVPQ